MAIKVTHSPAFSYLVTSLSISFAIIPGSCRVATERAGLQTELNKCQLIFPVLRRIEVRTFGAFTRGFVIAYFRSINKNGKVFNRRLMIFVYR